MTRAAELDASPTAFEYAHLEALKFLREASQYADPAALEDHFIRVLSAFGFDRYACARVDGLVKVQHPGCCRPGTSRNGTATGTRKATTRSIPSGGSRSWARPTSLVQRPGLVPR